MTTATPAELPKNFQAREAEDRWRQYWITGDFFRADNTSTANPFTIVIPPPNVTGVLHLGHGLVQTIQDILIRHHRMAGDNTLWVPGTDHAGIATQHVVVEKLRAEGKSRVDMGREAFLREVWRWKDEYHGRITSQIKTLGCSCDWSREAFTLDDERAASVRVAFKRFFDKGLIYRGKYMVNWDPVSLTALADDEVEYEEEESSLWHLKYPFADGSGRFAIVATTRPETLLGDIAVAVNPQDPRYKDVIGLEVELPLTGRRIPIIGDDFVRADFGSGMVKITPAHDPNDFQCALRQGLPMIDVFTESAALNDTVPEKYRGLDRYEARKAVVEDLKAAGLLEKIDKHSHRVGRGYRSKAIIEPRLSDQWFVKIAPLAERAVKAVRDGEIRILPEQQRNTYFAWMDNVRDWCISRQLWWGHRIPVWYRKDDPKVMVCWDGEGVPPEVAAAPDAWFQDNDVLDTWFSSALWPFSTMGWPNESAKDLNVYFPTSVLVTGHDILFFWVARMIMMSYELTGKPPFRDVYLHGLIFGKSYYRRRGGDMELVSPKERRELGLDEAEKLPAGIEFKWEKMSKSKGNVIDPLEMFELFGVDAVRLALVAYSGQGRTIEIDRQRISGYRNFVNKLWNSFRFVNSVTEGITPEIFRGGVLAEGLAREDRWILTRLAETLNDASKALNSYSFDVYIQTIYQFVWSDYCDWYLELVKTRVYGKEVAPDSCTAIAAKVVLLTVLEQVLRALHPVMPFASEEMWQLLRARLSGAATGEACSSAPIVPAEKGTVIGFRDGFHATSICVAPWPSGESFADAKACEEIALLQSVVGAIRNIRGEMALPPETKVDVLAAHPDAATRGILSGASGQIATLAGLKSLSVLEAQAPAPFASSFVSGVLQLQVLLPESLRAAELTRLAKEIARLQKGRDATNAKLTNEKFVASAPPEVVGKEKEKLAAYEGDIAALEAKRTALA